MGKLSKNMRTENFTNVAERILSKMIGRLVGFYGISTFVGYLMPNPIDTYDLPTEIIYC